MQWLIEQQSMYLSSELPDSAGKPGLLCTVLPRNEKHRLAVQHKYGIDPNIILWCEVEERKDHGLGRKHLVQLAVSLLVWKRTTGTLDLVLYSVGSKSGGILLCRDNQIDADCSDSDWEKTWTTAFDKARLPFKHRRLPSLMTDSTHE